MSYFTRLTGWLGFTPKDAAKSADVPAPTRPRSRYESPPGPSSRWTHRRPRRSQGTRTPPSASPR